MNLKYLDKFCDTISNSSNLKNKAFLTFYKDSIQIDSQNLQREIQNNLLLTNTDKLPYYFDVLNRIIKTTQFYNFSKTEFQESLDKYSTQLNLDIFPHFENEKLSNDLDNSTVSLFKTNEVDIERINLIRLDFFKYAAMLEAKKMIDFIEKEKEKFYSSKLDYPKIKWLGKPAHLGFLIGILADMDYIEPPKHKNNNFNYSQFSKQILTIFETNITKESLAKYLNSNDEKHLETKRNFEKEKFHIPPKNRLD